MVTIQSAQIYSSQGEMAYQIEYSDGTTVRAVEAPGHIIRCEHKTANGWKATCKPYVVSHSKVRNGERIKAAAQAFCK
jgi:hypothetical protein